MTSIKLTRAIWNTQTRKEKLTGAIVMIGTMLLFTAIAVVLP